MIIYLFIRCVKKASGRDAVWEFTDGFGFVFCAEQRGGAAAADRRCWRLHTVRRRLSAVPRLRTSAGRHLCLPPLPRHWLQVRSHLHGTAENVDGFLASKTSTAWRVLSWDSACMRSWEEAERDRLVFFPTTRTLKGYPINVRRREKERRGWTAPASCLLLLPSMSGWLYVLITTKKMIHVCFILA